MTEVAARWMKGATPDRAWLVRHALRTLIKRGDAEALAIVGAGEEPEVELGKIEVDARRVPVGGKTSISFTLTGRAERPQRLVVDYVVHYVKAHGEPREKVFKLEGLTLGPGERAALRLRLSFAQLSTRTHYPGRHVVELSVNGQRLPLAEIEVV